MSGSIWNPAGNAYVDTVLGNLTFSGVAARILADFSNATVASRTSIQSSTVDGNTTLEVIPNGAGTESGISFHNSSDANYAAAELKVTATEVALVSNKYGTDAYLPFNIKVNGSNKLEFALAGTIIAPNCTGLGYGTGSGGSVTQITSKATSVTLNKVSGNIITHNAALAAATNVSFNVSNSLVAADDCVILTRRNDAGTAGAYDFWVDEIAVGVFRINLRNMTAGALSEVLEFNFAVIKGSVT